jgi:peptidoglycan/xylan/chitin deacetylase (PgdA/CDA1 family)
LTTELPSALLVEHGLVPSTLPSTLDAVEPPLRPGPSGSGRTAPTTLFLTVDVEDSYFDRPILMTGDGIGREFGVFGILDELDSHGLAGTFFVNVYEKDRQPAGVVEGVVREIAERGHEVGLHSHPSPGLEFYGRPLFHLSRQQQTDILRWGADLIDRWTGSPPTSFRAGGYALDDHTFAAMEEVGIVIDSSCFFPSQNNRQERFTVNAIATRGAIIEVPITTVLQIADNTVKHSKLDLNWLSVEDLMAALGAVADHHGGFATFMMHSFSFIEKETRREGELSSPGATFTSDDVFGWRTDVYGPRPAMRQAFSSFLDRVAADPQLRVRTLAEDLPGLRAAGATEIGDLVPVIPGS